MIDPTIDKIIKEHKAPLKSRVIQTNLPDYKNVIKDLTRGDSELNRWERFMNGSGGTEGGRGEFGFGVLLVIAGLYFFLDSVTVTTASHGWFSGYLRTNIGTGSVGLIFSPFFLAIAMLFYDARLKQGWWLLGGSIALIVVEVFSRLNFLMHVKTTHLLLMIALFGAGTGLILNSYRDKTK